MYRIILLCLVAVVTSQIHIKKKSSFELIVNSTSKTKEIVSLFDQKDSLNQHDNTLYSPIAFQLALALLATLAKGKSSEEIKKRIHLPYDNKVIQEGFKELLLELKEKGDGDIKVVSGLFLKKNIPPKKEISDYLKKYYSSDLKNIDFSHEHNAVEQITKWSKKKSKNKIKKPLHKLPEHPQMVSVHAVVFSQKWKDSFLNEPVERPFRLMNGTTHSIKYLEIVAELKVIDDKLLKTTLVEIPFKNNFIMIIAMPNKTSFLPLMEEKLLQGAIQLPYKTKLVKLRIPQFDMEHKFYLAEALKKLGIKEIFEDGVDFSRLTKRKIKTSDIIQHTSVSINEDGITFSKSFKNKDSGHGKGSIKRKKNKKGKKEHFGIVEINKPFAFAILEADGRIPLFIGRVTKPETLQ